MKIRSLFSTKRDDKNFCLRYNGRKDIAKESTMEQNSINKGFYIAGLLVPPIAFPLFFWIEKLVGAGVMPGCPARLYLHLYCPGCGGSRALHLFLQGRFLMSFLYHPIVLYVALIYIPFMVTQTLGYVTKGKIRGMLMRMGYLYGALAVIGINWVVKNVLLIGWGIDFLT